MWGAVLHHPLPQAAAELPADILRDDRIQAAAYSVLRPFRRQRADLLLASPPGPFPSVFPAELFGFSRTVRLEFRLVETRASVLQHFSARVQPVGRVSELRAGFQIYINLVYRAAAGTCAASRRVLIRPSSSAKRRA